MQRSKSETAQLWEWKDTNSYLRNETNKIELFQYLSGVIAQSNIDESKVVAASQGAFPGADPDGQDPPSPLFLSNYNS